MNQLEASQIINRTPHEVCLMLDGAAEWEWMKFPKSEDPIRLDTEVEEAATICVLCQEDEGAGGFSPFHPPAKEGKLWNPSIPMMRVKHSGGNLPPFNEGVFLIVSALVQGAFPDRRDLIIPNDLVRDEDGRIVGCRSFAIR